MKAQHTPGPWTTHEYENVLSGQQVIIRKGKQIIAECGPHMFGDGKLSTSRGNAALIAAAPDLLAALEDMENVLSGKPYSRDEQIILHRARAALAKAKGE